LCNLRPVRLIIFFCLYPLVECCKLSFIFTNTETVPRVFFFAQFSISALQGRIQDFKLGGALKKNCAEWREARKFLGYFVFSLPRVVRVCIEAKRHFFCSSVLSSVNLPPLTFCASPKHVLFQTVESAFKTCPTTAWSTPMPLIC
jgi:hypothetical protein